MKKLITILLLLPLMAMAQNVGINTKNPRTTLDVNGHLMIKASIGTTSDTILVIRKDQVLKVPASAYYTLQNACPLFQRSQSSGYYLLFKSASSIDNPNNALVIQNKTFVSAGTWIENNTYYFSYTNTSGIPININELLVVSFGNQTCSYSNEN